MAKTIAENLTSIVNSKEAIRQAIVAKGQACAKTVPFSQYAGKISAITAGTQIVVQSNADFYQCVFCADGVWSGYKAVLKDGKYSFQTTLTEGLKYTSVKPEVGKIYTVDALAQIAYLYDISGTGGECPNLADCVSTSCILCNEKYCKTHGTHTCGGDNGGSGGGGGGTKKCPNLPSCAKVSCPDCKKDYCKTHDKHDCGGDNGGNGDGGDSGSGSGTSRPENCPNGWGCLSIPCPDCNTVYCSVHDTHTCGSNACPNSKYCVTTLCSCGARYCALHQSHPTDRCCPNRTDCKYTTCEKCFVRYCTAHGSHTASQCCPNSKNCEVVACGDASCGEYVCGKHDASGHTHCPRCGMVFCSTNHIHGVDACPEAPECELCGTNTDRECSKCNRDLCDTHISNHCCASGCTNSTVAATCVCGKRYCANHEDVNGSVCTVCNKYLCEECSADHDCSALCSVDGCGANAGYQCDACAALLCQEHGFICLLCGCVHCTNCAHTHTCCPDGKNCVKTPCENCAEVYCSAHGEHHCSRIVCAVDGCTKDGTLTCPKCDMSFCADHLVDHTCELIGVCTASGCNSTSNLDKCDKCGAVLCGDHQLICGKGNDQCIGLYCEDCRDNHTCNLDEDGCGVSGCSGIVINLCGGCGKHYCVNHIDTHECTSTSSHNCDYCSNKAAVMCSKCSTYYCRSCEMATCLYCGAEATDYKPAE